MSRKLTYEEVMDWLKNNQGPYVAGPPALEVGMVPEHLFPREPARTTVNDLGSKLAALILLNRSDGRLVVPNEEEWIGVNLLERDDELPPRRPVR